MRRTGLAVLAAVLVILPATALGWLDPAQPDVEVFPDTEDTQFSFYYDINNQNEWLLNWGRATSTRLKGHENCTAMKFDLSSLRGRTVVEAELHLARANSANLFAVVASTINADWHEGNGWGSAAQVGESCWRWRSRPVDPSNPQPGDEWTFPYSDFTTAAMGNYGSLVSYAYPVNGTMGTYAAGGYTWVRVKLDPDLAHALILDQYGLAVTDPRDYQMSNSTVYTREAGSAAQPRLYIRTAETLDTTPPDAVTGLAAEPGEESGSVVLHFAAPNDPQADKAFGYDVIYDLQTPGTTPVERWRIPRPEMPDTPQKMLIEGLTPGGTYNFHVAAYDHAGNRSGWQMVTLTLPPARADGAFSGPPLPVPDPAGKTVRTVPNVLRYWAVSELIKVNPVTGNRLEDGYGGTGAEDYKKANLVWDAATNTVSLAGCRNEMVGAQLLIERLATSLTNVSVTVGDLIGPGGAVIPSATHVELFQLHYVTSGSTYFPDPAVPLAPPFPTTFSIPDPNRNPIGRNQSVWMDVYVPKNAPAGEYVATIAIDADQLAAPVTATLSLAVSPVRLPDESTWLIDLNGYGNKWDYGDDWRLTTLRWFQTAHKHRMVPNCLPYGWSAAIWGDRAPELGGAGETLHVADWSAFDHQYGALFDGTAFSPSNPDSPYYGPGMNTPIPDFYTTFFESWPIHLLDPDYGFDAPSLAGEPGTYGYGGQYWEALIDGDASQQAQFWGNAPDVWRAFPPGYWQGVQNIVKEWFEHAQQKGWHRTAFQVYFNHKYYYIQWANCAALWILEECVHGDDYRAVNLFHNIFQGGAALADAPDVNWHWRLDISTRFGQNYGQLDNLIDLQCMSTGGLQWYWPHIKYRKYSVTKPEQWWFYGGGPGPQDNGTGHAPNFLQQWARGLDGGTPYWDNYQFNWNSASGLCLYYTGQDIPGFGTYDGGIASIRMKMMRQASQICELLNILSGRKGWNRTKATEALLAKYTDGNRGRSFGSMTERELYQLHADLLAEIEPLLPMPGDANEDDVVNVIDLLMLAHAFATQAGENGFDPRVDFNADGHINAIDLLIMANNFGQSRG